MLANDMALKRETSKVRAAMILRLPACTYITRFSSAAVIFDGSYYQILVQNVNI